MKVAIAHDFLNQEGGAERVTLALSEIFPEAPIFTLFINNKKIGDAFKKKNIITSSLQKKAHVLNFRHKYLLPFIPQAVEELDFSTFDVVLSSTSAWMKGIITKPETTHISYCHTPTRFLWMNSKDYIFQQNVGFIKSFFIKRILGKIRIWDKVAADRVDYWLANSFLTKERIKKYYKKESEVIYPPVDTEKFSLSKVKKDYFLIVSRLSPYKRIDLAVDAFGKLGLNLIVIGEGSQKKELEKKAKSNIKFLGFLNDQEVLKYYKECRAFVFPSFDEDFGLTPVEAMACGKPVIAAGRGGTRETIKEGITGEFFLKPTVDSLISTANEFIKNEENFRPEKIREEVLKFDKKSFSEKIKNFAEKMYDRKKGEFNGRS